MATKKQATYRVVTPFGDFTEGEELTTKQLGADLDARLADGSIVLVEDAAPAAPAEPTTTTVVGDNGTITATVK